MQLTKSRYVSAVQCHRRIWLEFHRPDLAAPPSAVTQRILEQGRQVGAAARLRFPDGILIRQSGHQAIAATWRALRAGCHTIYEATFQAADILVRCDILQRTQAADGRDHWAIIEVKSSTSITPSYLHDLAIQRYVVEQAGLPVHAVYLMHINSKDCVYPDLDNLFALCDVTAEVDAAAVDLPSRLLAIRAVLEQPEPPQVTIGAQCDDPGPCPFHAHCWADVPPVSIFNIPGLAPKTKTELAARGILALEDLPPELPLTERQTAFVELLVNQRTQIDVRAIEQRLDSLIYPVHFFDFETDASPVPLFAGLHPYQAFPFQYSCHVLHADGRLEHRDYLHDDAGDPRLPLTQALLRDIGPAGSVVVYYASFERTVLQNLARHLPAYAEQLKSVIDRLWDQYEIFRDHYRSAHFHGSNSIKHVLPALVPHLSYAGLAVRKGDQAQAHWRAMIETAAGPTRARMARELKEYCGLDTLAMVELHRVLTETIDRAHNASETPFMVELWTTQSVTP